MKKIALFVVALALLLSLCSCSQGEEKIVKINLSDEGITVDGEAISTKKKDAVYSAFDIVCNDGNSDLAKDHTVVHITKAGKYELQGKLSLGQIAVDLGEGAEKKSGAVVTLILNGVDITSKVSPAVIFYRAYECANANAENAQMNVDTQNAGARVIISDNTENYVNGSYVSETGDHKYDGAFYSKVSMNIYGGDKGNGALEINGENEGLDSELHLSVFGGEISITAGNDGINANADGKSVVAINGGKLNVVSTGSTGEGDGIDSNGWIVVNKGEVTAFASGSSQDFGLDSDMGIYLNDGKVLATGNMSTRITKITNTYAFFGFDEKQTGGETYFLKDNEGKTVGEYKTENDFFYLLVAGDELAPGDYSFWRGETKLTAQKTEQIHSAGPEKDLPVKDGVKPEKTANRDGNVPLTLLAEFVTGEGEANGKNSGKKPDVTEKDDAKDKNTENGNKDKVVPDISGSQRPEKEEETEEETAETPVLKQTGSDVFTLEKGANFFTSVTEKTEE